MFGKSHRVNPLESRRQLLVVESEINRAQMLQEWKAIADGASGLAQQARSFGSIASAAALLTSRLGAFRCNGSAPAGPKPSTLETVLKGARLACSVWLMLRARPRS